MSDRKLRMPWARSRALHRLPSLLRCLWWCLVADAVGAAQSTPPHPDPHLAGYTLVFSDEFDGDELRRDLWCTRYQYGGGPPVQVPNPGCGANGRGTLDFLGGGTGTPEQQRYVDFNSLGQPLHRVTEGVLSLVATKTRDDPGAPYESAMLRSKMQFRPSAERSYYFTARVRLPRMRGTWPAFWLSPGIGPDGKTGWPPEIDILEAPLNDKWDTDNMAILKPQMQNWDGTGTKGMAPVTFARAEYDAAIGKLRAKRSLRETWLEAGLEWSEKQACFYLDGEKVACTAYEWKHNDGQPAPAAVVLLNLAVGGWAGRNGIDDGKLPVSFEIDFVRVYSIAVAAVR